jgi:Starch-binding associating with outer membrane
MKRIKIGILIICAVVLAATSCTKDFEELNSNPNEVTDPNLDYIFTYSIVRTNGQGFEMHRANLIYSSAMVQHFASLNGYWTGDKYTYSSEYSSAFFGSMYPAAIRELSQLVEFTSQDPELVNKHSASRIMRVYAMHRITDLYGDVPYTEAGMGYTNGVFKPKYDRQSDIYADMLKELDESASAFDGSKGTFGDADLLYKGDIAKWKKFAYSLMLRLGMRLTKVDAALAQQWVTKALSGGVFQDNSDLARLEHATGPEGINRNPTASQLLSEEIKDGGSTSNSKLSKTLIDFLKNNADPRLRVIARKENSGDNDPVNQQGLPNGYDNTTIQGFPGWTQMADYSDPNTLTMARADAPSILLSTAEVKFLQAEAAIRGWGSGDAQTLYNEGVTAAMSMMNMQIPSGGSVANITAGEIATYLGAHPFNTAGTEAQKMEQVHTQLWAALFFNAIEAFANWRRTGFPVLTPVNYPGNITNGTIPRRLRYPEAEAVNNTDSYQEAVAQQGPDEFTTRVWWDRQ